MAISINKIYACWVYVSDLQKSINFYTAIGFKVKLTPEKTRIMFMVDDIESMYEILKQHNVTIIGNIKDESYGKLLTFFDPDGH